MWQKIWGIVKKGFKRYFIDAMSAMALGLFASLLIGQIMGMLARIPYMEWLSPMVSAASHPAVVGAAIGVACAWGLKAKPLAIFASAVTGALGYGLEPGGAGPIGAFCAAVVGVEIARLISGKTPVDIVLTPLVTIVAGGLIARLVSPGVSALMGWLGGVVNSATELAPVPMGMAVSVLMGMILTAPISSAALSISLGLSGLAAGAAAVGCSTQMVGFAVASYRENKVGGLLAQGIGTSMLQFGNIMRHPQIWIPPTLASAILGPISSAVFKMTNTPFGGGMGTAGLVGQFNAFEAMMPTFGAWPTLGLVLLMHFILPAALTLIISETMRRLGWIKPGDMLLPER